MSKCQWCGTETPYLRGWWNKKNVTMVCRDCKNDAAKNARRTNPATRPKTQEGSLPKHLRTNDGPMSRTRKSPRYQDFI